MNFEAKQLRKLIFHSFTEQKQSEKNITKKKNL